MVGHRSAERVREDETPTRGVRCDRDNEMKELSDRESERDNADDDIRRKIHDTLDLMEGYLRQIARYDFDGPNPIDLLMQLRERVNEQLTQHRRSPS